MKKLTIPSIDEITEINRKLGCEIVNRGTLDFILTKIRSRRLTKDLKLCIATGAAILWYEIITNHPFLDGNKRTATESMRLFLELNNFELETSLAGMTYISLRIANNDMPFKEFVEWLQGRLKAKDEIIHPV